MYEDGEMMTKQDTSRRPQGETRSDDDPREQGFTLIVALLVMGLLTTLGLSLLFTAETERTMMQFSWQCVDIKAIWTGIFAPCSGTDR